jgi:hypothetical protein
MGNSDHDHARKTNFPLPQRLASTASTGFACSPLSGDVAINLDRIAACLTDWPLAATRTSRFAALAA